MHTNNLQHGPSYFIAVEMQLIFEYDSVLTHLGHVPLKSPLAVIRLRMVLFPDPALPLLGQRYSHRI